MELGIISRELPAPSSSTSRPLTGSQESRNLWVLSDLSGNGFSNNGAVPDHIFLIYSNVRVTASNQVQPSLMPGVSQPMVQWASRSVNKNTEDHAQPQLRTMIFVDPKRQSTQVQLVKLFRCVSRSRGTWPSRDWAPQLRLQLRFCPPQLGELIKSKRFTNRCQPRGLGSWRIGVLVWVRPVPLPVSCPRGSRRLLASSSLQKHQHWMLSTLLSRNLWEVPQWASSSRDYQSQRCMKYQYKVQ